MINLTTTSIFKLASTVGMILILMFVVLPDAWACPNCAGSENSSDQYTVYILGVFVLLTYIPFYIFLRMARQNQSPANAKKTLVDGKNEYE